MTMTGNNTYGGSTPTGPYHMERKLKKPLMEKRRRARINECLMEMKSLLLHAAPHQRSKLEKADILEMTLQYMRRLSKQPPPPTADSGSARQTYIEGYMSCAGAVLQYMNCHPENAHPQLRVGLMTHLNGYMNQRIKSVSAPPPHVTFPNQGTGPAGNFLPAQNPYPQPHHPGGAFPLTVSIPNQHQPQFHHSASLPTPPYGVSMETNRRDSAIDSPGSSFSSSSLSPISSTAEITHHGDLNLSSGSSPTQKNVWRPW